MFLGVENALRSSDQGYYDHQKGSLETTVAWQRQQGGGWILYAAWSERQKQQEVTLQSEAEDPGQALWELRGAVSKHLS